MNKAHKIRLYPTLKQEIFFRKSCGVSRFSFNWALNKWNEKYINGEKTSAYSLIKELNSIKRKEFVWMQETGKTCSQYAIHNLEAAFKKYFRGLKDGSLSKKKQAYIKLRKEKGLPIDSAKLKNFGKPKFKKKWICDSFIAVENKQTFEQKDFKIWIPKLGYVQCAENLRFEGKVNYVAVKRIANVWFAVINIVSDETSTVCDNQAIVGVDLGIKSLAVTSDGKVYKNPKALKSKLRLLKIQQKALSRKVFGGKNYKKQKTKVARLHYKISCVRKDVLHKSTSDIVNNAGVIVLEDLNVSGMMKNRKLSQAISDCSWSEFRRMIEYKAKWQNKKVIIVDRFFASSKTCSCCGWKNDELKLSDRIFKCKECNLEIDRDLNASINLAKYGSTARLAGGKAFGVGSSASEMVYSLTTKNEINRLNNKTNNILVI